MSDVISLCSCYTADDTHTGGVSAAKPKATPSSTAKLKATPAAAKRPAASSAGNSTAKKSKQAVEGAPKREATGGFVAPIKLSPELSEFVGKESAARGELTKFFWNYWKSNSMQDPQNGKFIISDEKMKGLFGVDRFEAFKIQKLLGPHLLTVKKE